MIRTYLEFELVPGGAALLQDVFTRHEVLATSAAQPGCLGAELTIAADGQRAVVTALWENRAAYDEWTSRSDRADLAPELQPALATPIDEHTVGRIFDVAIVG